MIRVFTKLLKILISPLRKINISGNIFGQYVDFGSHNTRSSHESRHSNISPVQFGLSTLHPCQKTIFGNGNSIKMSSSLTKQKEKNVKRYQGFLWCPYTTLLKLTKLICLFSFTIQYWNLLRLS